MELRRVVRSWPTVEERLIESYPEWGGVLRRSCRPMAAERRLDGRLTLVVGCWLDGDLDALARPVVASHLESALSAYLDDQVRPIVLPWPGGVLEVETVGRADEVAPPDLLQGLPEESRVDGALCESAIERMLFAGAWRAGLRLQPQFQAMHFRLDFALPAQRVGVEILGWDGPGGRDERWERFQELGLENWRVQRFSGRAVYEDPDACVDRLRRVTGGGRTRRRD